MIGRIWNYPCPMLQLTVFRRNFLAVNNLKCIYGLRHQDSEFSPRALYLAQRVVPIHEAFYIYRIRKNSVQTKAKGKNYFYKDWTYILNSLFAFHAKVCQDKCFDRRISQYWAKAWITLLQIKWFSREFVNEIPRAERVESLKNLFAEGYHDFNLLLSSSSCSRKIAGWWIRAFVMYPPLRPLAELFFVRFYLPLTERKSI